jgi:hypothetical protein
MRRQARSASRKRPARNKPIASFNSGLVVLGSNRSLMQRIQAKTAGLACFAAFAAWYRWTPA